MYIINHVYYAMKKRILLMSRVRIMLFTSHYKIYIWIIRIIRFIIVRVCIFSQNFPLTVA